jgi:hypothetical protein
MIGQQVVGTLVRPTLSGSTQSWSVTQGDKFADYQASQGSAHVTDYNVNNTETGLSTSVFFRAPGLATIKCSVFVGGPIQQNVSLQRNITVEKPSSTIAVSIGEVKLGSPEGYLEMALLDSASLGTEYNDDRAEWVGIRWGANPFTPAPWSDAGFGKWQWVQVVWPSRYWTFGGQEEGLAENGLKLLDHHYPYEGAGDADNTGRTSSDTPGTGLAHPPYTSVRTSAEPFKTHLMYRPPALPGFTSKWVSLKEVTWYWSGRADWNGSQWTGPFYPAAQWSYTGDFPRQLEWEDFLWHPEIPGPWVDVH